jgi:DNA-binding response OmpR family regulator
MRILVVEPDELAANVLVTILGNQNYAVEVVMDGQTAWEFIDTYPYDLVMIETHSPNLDGVSLCQQIRSHHYLLPIILMTHQSSGHDKAIGLDAGADDYLMKPFDSEELAARIRALFRRSCINTAPILEWENLRFDPKSCEATYQGRPLVLTAKECALLELFLRNPRRIFSCRSILEHLWAYEEMPGEEAVRTHMKGLRQKLKAVYCPGDFIETVYGMGYRLKSVSRIQASAPKPHPAPCSVHSPLFCSFHSTRKGAIWLIENAWKSQHEKFYKLVEARQQDVVLSATYHTLRS